MSRYKFRAWDKKEKVMMYDDKTASHDIDYWDGVCSSKVGLINSQLNNNRFVWMLCTGREDKNGEQEVYDGDLILIDGRRTCKVVWNSYQAGFDLDYVSDTSKEDFKVCPIKDIGDRGELIGNIHEGIKDD